MSNTVKINHVTPTSVIIPASGSSNVELGSGAGSSLSALTVWQPTAFLFVPRALLGGIFIYLYNFTVYMLTVDWERANHANARVYIADDNRVTRISNVAGYVRALSP